MIFQETRDLKDGQVRKTVEKLYRRHYRHETDKSKWRLLNKHKNLNYINYTKQHLKQLYIHFIKELEQGRYIVDKSVPVYCRVPYFIKDETDKFRFIPDYSYPKYGVSINSIIKDKFASVELNDKIELVKFVYNNGNTNWLGKNDYKSWYRQFPMHKSNWSISVYHFQGIDFIDTRMPWGTRPATRVAHHFSIAIAHICYKYIPRSLIPCWFNYVDDHILRAPTKMAGLYIHVIYMFVTMKLGIKCNLKKTILIAQIMDGLGIQLNVKDYVIALTQRRTRDLIKHLVQLYQLQYSDAKYGQIVAGKCEDISFTIPTLKAQLRHLRNQIPCYLDTNQRFKITPQIRNMCVYWCRALYYIHNRKMSHILNLPTPNKRPCYTDASNEGYGIYYDGHWIYDNFDSHEVQTHDRNNICERELFPVLVAAHTFGPTWTGSLITLRIDNTPACQAIAKKDIRNMNAHAMLVRICEAMMKYKFEFSSLYINTKQNYLADALSRLEIKKFKAICQVKNIPYDPQPTPFQRPWFPTTYYN